MRDFATVLASVIAEIPEEEPALIDALANVQKKAARYAPEIRWHFCGIDAQHLIRIHVYGMSEQEREGWRGRALAAWTGAAT